MNSLPPSPPRPSWLNVGWQVAEVAGEGERSAGRRSFRALIRKVENVLLQVEGEATSAGRGSPRVRRPPRGLILTGGGGPAQR